MGTTHVLEGTAVTVLKETGASDSRGAPGYVLEMSGGAAAGTKYASLHHLILIPHTKRGLPGHAQQKAYRLAGLKTAVYLARATVNGTPVSTHAFDPVGPGEDNQEGLPRVAYIGKFFRASESRSWASRYYTAPIRMECYPSCFIPTNGSTERWSPPTTTPWGRGDLLLSKSPGHRRTLPAPSCAGAQLCGTVATIAAADNFDRDRNCRFAANLVRWTLKADAAVLTKFGGGVPHADLAETARLLEGMDIKTAVQVTDLARDRRLESALLFNFPRSTPSSASGATARRGRRRGSKE